MPSLFKYSKCSSVVVSNRIICTSPIVLLIVHVQIYIMYIKGPLQGQTNSSKVASSDACPVFSFGLNAASCVPPLKLVAVGMVNTWWVLAAAVIPAANTGRQAGRQLLHLTLALCFLLV